MDSNGNQRKRVGRMAKNANEKSPSHNENIENSAVAISPTLEEPESGNNAPASECRRSSRKKIIKFDVRDLLNKNRKTHKIQIEARIDSNAPSTSKATTAGGNAAANLKTLTSREDLLSKHKTFLEKSAIFRRYSISQEQKPPPPLPIPPLLNKSSEKSKDSSFCGTSSSQEFLSHALIKPKEPTSLIVAQIESNKPTSTNLAKRKSLNKSPQTENVVESKHIPFPNVQQKKRGRPAKIKPQTSEKTISIQEENATNITPEKAKNWKEYKACLAKQSSSSNDEKNISKENSILIRKQDSLNEALQLDTSKSDDDGSFSGFQFSKDDFSCDSPVSEKSSEEVKSIEDVSSITEQNENLIWKDKIQLNEKTTYKTRLSNKNVVSDKKKTSFSEEEKLHQIIDNSNKQDLNLEKVVKQIEIKEDNQNKKIEPCVVKNVKERKDVKGNNNSALETQSELIASENIEKTTKIAFISDECAQEEKASTVTPKPEITIKTSCEQKIKNSQLEKNKECVEQAILETKDPRKESNCSKTTTSKKNCTPPRIAETVTETKILKDLDVSSKNEEDNKLPTKMEESGNFLISKQTVVSQASTPSFDNKSLSRTSSSSESENASDRSSYSSEPFSTTSSSSSSPRSYKSGDKVMISVKRVSLPKSPSTSSQTSTSEDLNNTDIVKRKPPIAKRSKRLQKKLDESGKTENTADNIDVGFQRIPYKKNGDGNLVTELSVEKNQSENLANSLNENLTKSEAPDLVTKVVEELTTKEIAMNSDESSTSSEKKSPKSNKSSNIEKSPDLEKNIKRKSLRNRKNDSLKEDEVPVKTKSEVKETANEKQKNLKKDDEGTKSPHEKSVNEENSIDRETSSISGKSDKSEETIPRRNTRKAQTLIPQNERQFEKPATSAKEEMCSPKDKIEILVNKQETKIQAEDLTNTANFIIEKNIIELKNEEKPSIVNKAVSMKDQTITEITKSKSEKSSKIEKASFNDDEIETVLNIEQKTQDALNLKKEQEQLPKQSSPKHLACQKENVHSKGNVFENQNKTNSSTRKATEKVSENNITPTGKKTSKIENDLETTEKTESSESTSTKGYVDNKIVITKTKKEELTAKQSKNIEEYEIFVTRPTSSKKEVGKNKDITELIQVNDGEKALSSTKSQTENLTRNKCEKERNVKIEEVDVKTNNKEDVTLNDFKVQDKQQAGVEAKETPAIETDQQKKVSCEMKQKPDEIIFETEKDIGANKAGKYSYKSLSSCTIMQKEKLQLEKKDESFKYEELVPTSEISNAETLNSTQSETEKLQVETVFEKVSKTLSTKGRKSKEVISNKKSSQSESPIHSAAQQGLKKEQESSEKKSVHKDICLTDKPLEAKKKDKDDTSAKLPTATSEVREVEMSTKVQETENVTKAQENKSVLEATKLKSTVKKSSINEVALTKSEECGEQNHPASPKRTTSKKALNLPKEFATQNPSKTSTKSSASFKSSEETKCLTKTKLAVENLTSELSKALQDARNLKPHSSGKLFPEAPSEISLLRKSTVSLKPTESSKQSSEATLDDTLNESNKTSETKKLMKGIMCNTQLESPPQENKVIPLAGHSVTKRRGRKPRFKNLHGPEDSETDNSNEKITPIHENKVGPIDKLEDIQGLQKSSEIEIKKKQEDINAGDVPICIQDDAKNNLSTSQIKNVSIETNTLLDILRTVQSNTAAALKANKSPTYIDRTDNETSKLNMEESLKSSQDLLKIQQKETISIISEVVSPFTAKKRNLSPARSDSNSPLTLKKVTTSPTRSNSSSPLTLKKVTRRYERRSRHGEDSAHKTLEETFAEIAAQSTKAVLAAKEFDETSPEKLDLINTAVIAEGQVKENLADVENVSAPTEIGSNADTDNKHFDVLLDVEQDKDKKEIVTNEICDDTMENVVGMDAAKTTPTRRGRKPKNRNSELPTVSKDPEVISADVKADSRDAELDTQKQAGVEIKSKEEGNENKHDSKKVSESLETSFDENLADHKIKTSSPITTFTKETDSSAPTEKPLKHIEDVNENKSNKKPIKKREIKIALEEYNLLPNTESCLEKTDEVRTPKQPIKKRDSFLNKSETKSASKKGLKNAKSEEEDSLNSTKEDSLTKITATTPPPSKRGRKPKTQQPETPQSSSKKKNKKEVNSKNDREETNEDKVKLLDSESEPSLNTSLDKSIDEKLAKKKRQKKLKEAFEAALAENKEKSKESSTVDTSSPTSNFNFDLHLFNNSPPPEKSELFSKEDQSKMIKLTCITPVETEEDLDPLKDIEKFIADGVNLLKKDYKLDEDSVENVIEITAPKETKILEESNDDIKTIFNTFETPADTPLNTPSVTPPPKSPSSLEPTTPDENSGVRRSHRIKLITKTPKALVGRGLVRDRERFSIKDDVETKSHYTLDDHLTDLAEVEAKNAKFLKEMEERLSNFQVIKENEYLCERVISREARKMICDCFLTHEEEDRGELGCGEDCLNRLLMIECGFECNVKERCTNKRFQKWLCSPCRVFRTEKKGFGIMADIEILPGEFIMEYVGEVIDTEEFEKRRIMYSQEKNRHYYFMALRSDAIIDATIKGNISRFINHSCDPNAETQKWTVNGELRIGFFSRKSIMPGEEITFNYQYQRYGREAQRCYCESSNCTGWIGQEPTSDEGEQMDDEYDETEDEEEEAVNSNLLVHDDEDDSDASVADPEEVQKQLEMAAAQAEVELAPLQLIQEEDKHKEQTSDEGKNLQDLNKSDNEEDSKSKFKKLLSKMAEKVAAKQKQNKREQKLQRKKKSKESSSELANKLRFLEDPDIEDEVRFLKQCGLKNQSDTLRLSRLIVRAKLVQTRLNLLEILRKGDLPCRRLFLDYHGLRLLHGWMSEDGGNMQIRLSLLQTLETLPVANKTVLTDSKVMQAVRTWSGPNSSLSPNEDSSSSNSNSQDVPVLGSSTFEEGSEGAELQKLALKLITTWEGLPEIFRIPKKERIEQMKEHEREADRQYAANAEIQENTTATDRYRRDRFGRGLSTPNNNGSTSNRFIKPNGGNPHKTASTTPENLKNLSKTQRREMFAAKVARDEAEKRLAEERREFETKCRFFGLDPKKTRTQDLPFCVNPATGQWFSIERKPITTPPSYAHVQVPVKSKSTDPKDYQLPAVCSTLPPQWKYAITAQGKIYYYHIKHRITQWEPPSPAQLQQCELEAREEESESEITSTAGEDSSDDDDDILIGMDAAQLKAYIDRKIEMRRQKRYLRLVDERSISPRREEDRIYNQIEVRKYKENKEKIRKRKEDIRRRRAEAIRQTSLNLCTLGSITDATPSASKLNTESDEELGVLPIQDYLLSSDEEIDIKAEVNSPLIDKIVEGDKIVDELDALTTKRQLKRPLPPHRDLSEPSTSSSSISALIATTIAAKQEYKKRKLEKKEKRKPKEQDAKYRKNKEKFRCEIAGIIVHHLKPYLKETCTIGRIQSNEDFNHLARKLTHFVMIKELKYCESVGQTLVVTESVKSKSREFIKKYMAKYGDGYVKPINDPDFKDIPFTL